MMKVKKANRYIQSNYDTLHACMHLYIGSTITYYMCTLLLSLTVLVDVAGNGVGIGCRRLHGHGTNMNDRFLRETFYRSIFSILPIFVFIVGHQYLQHNIVHDVSHGKYD